MDKLGLFYKAFKFQASNIYKYLNYLVSDLARKHNLKLKLGNVEGKLKEFAKEPENKSTPSSNSM